MDGQTRALTRVPLRFAAALNRHVLPETTAANFSFRYIDISTVDNAGRVTVPDYESTFANSPSRARRLAPAGATAISTVRTYLRAIANVPESKFPLVFSTGFAIAEAATGFDPRYLYYACRSEELVEQVVARSVGVSYPAISPSDLGAIQIPSVPVDAQRKIANFLDDQVARIDNIIAGRRTQLHLVDASRLAQLDSAFDAGSRPLVRLGLFATVQSGITVDGGREGNDGIDVPYLRVANVQAGSVRFSHQGGLCDSSDWRGSSRRGFGRRGVLTPRVGFDQEIDPGRTPRDHLSCHP